MLEKPRPETNSVAFRSNGFACECSALLVKPKPFLENTLRLFAVCHQVANYRLG